MHPTKERNNNRKQVNKSQKSVLEKIDKTNTALARLIERESRNDTRDEKEGIKE